MTTQTLQSVKDLGMVVLKTLILLLFSFGLFYGHMATL